MEDIENIPVEGIQVILKRNFRLKTEPFFDKLSKNLKVQNVFRIYSQKPFDDV